jgi:hypothetical protein
VGWNKFERVGLECCVDWTVDDWFTQLDDVAQICTTGFMKLYTKLKLKAALSGLFDTEDHYCILAPK